MDQAAGQKPQLDALAAAYVYLQWIGTGALSPPSCFCSVDPLPFQNDQQHLARAAVLQHAETIERTPQLGRAGAVRPADPFQH